MKDSSTIHLPSFRLTASPETFHTTTRTQASKCPAEEEKKQIIKVKEEGGENAKSLSQDCCVTFNSQKLSKFCNLRKMAELKKSLLNT